MYADAQQSWALAPADKAATSPEAGPRRWPLPVSVVIGSLMAVCS